MSSTWSHPAFESVAQILQANTGLVFARNTSLAAEAGTRRAMERVGVDDVGTYLDMLQSGRVGLADLVDELAVCESYFFRQPGQFDFIRRRLIPEIRKRRGPGCVIKAWSAGCASGEEPFSLAVLFEEEGLSEQSRIIASDISRVALSRAREASYGHSSLRGVPESLVRRYFRRSGYSEVLDDRLRQRVLFRQLNLVTDPFPGATSCFVNMDLILCRNVLIYFDRPTTARVAEKLYLALAEGGWLIVGGSDPPFPAEVPFETVITPHGVCYRKPATRRGDARPVDLLAAMSCRAAPAQRN